MRKKLLSILALLCLTVSSAWAGGAVVTSGNCGTYQHESDVTWTLTEDKVLTISGSGDMANYSIRGYEFSPWHNRRGDIVSIIIESDVTRIGDCAFYDCTSLTSIAFPTV